MKKLVAALTAAIALSVMSAPTFAAGAVSFSTSCWGSTCMDDDEVVDADGGEMADAVPEINGASAGLALALMGGIVAIGRERRRNKA